MFDRLQPWFRFFYSVSSARNNAKLHYDADYSSKYLRAAHNEVLKNHNRKAKNEYKNKKAYKKTPDFHVNTAMIRILH